MWKLHPWGVFCAEPAAGDTVQGTRCPRCWRDPNACPEDVGREEWKVSLPGYQLGTTEEGKVLFSPRKSWLGVGEASPCEGTRRVNPAGAEQGWALLESALIPEEPSSLLARERWHFLKKQTEVSFSRTRSGALICLGSWVLETVLGLCLKPEPL